MLIALVVGATVASQMMPVGSGASGVDWPVYHGDLLGSGIASTPSSATGLQPAWTSRALLGQIYGEPLVAGNDVLVATERNYVYALDATKHGRVLWRTKVGTAVPSRLLPCGDIQGRVGITSTPVVDAARSEIFVVADEFVNTVIAHHLVGLSLSNGAVLLDQVVDPPGSDPAAQLQRAALTLANGRVVIAEGGNFGDCSIYHGWVVAVPEAGGAPLTFEAAPTSGNDRAAIWMGGAAPAVDASGNIWIATGNGSITSGNSPDYSDSVIELSPSLQPVQSFTPLTWAADNDADLDLGSSPPALLSNGLAFQLGKSETGYALNQSQLGGIGGQQTQQAPLCASFGGDAFVGQTVYVPCTSGIMALQVNPSPPSISTQWTSSTGPSGPPIVAGGLVWTISHTRGVLYGLDPQTGKVVANEAIGGVANHFSTPSFGDGVLIAPSAKRIRAFTLVP